MALEFVTQSDERERCCVIKNGHRCAQPTAARIAHRDGALDDYTHVCSVHLQQVLTELGSEYVATRVN